MVKRTWDKDRAAERIQKKIDEVALKDITIKDYVRDADLFSLPKTVAYRVNGAHLYADITNLEDILATTAIEGETSHRRALRFLNLHYRAVSRILDRVDAILVDFHNQRLHSVFAKPYGSESDRIHKAIATGQLIIDVLAQTGENADHPAAAVRIGIDSGEALAVNNGRHAHREPLFLGEPANHAAKRAGGGKSKGIYLTNNARVAIGLAEVENEDRAPLTTAEIETSQKAASLGVTAETIVSEWKADLEKNPIGSFDFSGHTLPFQSLDIDTLSVKNSRRQDAISVYADIDGFTAYVADHIGSDDDAKHVVRALHVLRSELHHVLMDDFFGIKIRYIGDCIHGLIGEGTAQTTNAVETIDTATLCAGGMRSSFDLAIEKLNAAGTNAKTLGLAIGFEYGPMTITRLGMKSELIRCSVSRGVTASEEEQKGCSGKQSAIGATAYEKASEQVKSLFGPSRRKADINYELAESVIKLGETASKTSAAQSLLRPATAAAASTLSFPAKAAQPAKLAGFA